MSLQTHNGATPLTTIELGGQKRSAGFISFLSELDRQEKAKDAALVAPLNATMRKIVAQQRIAWSRPVAEIQRAGESWLESLTPNLGLPTMDESVLNDPDRATEAGYAAREAIVQFLKSMTSRSGYVLSQGGQQRLKQFIFAQTKIHGVEITDDALWASLQFLLDGECFAPDEYGYDESLKVVQPKPDTPMKRMTLADAEEVADGSEASNHRLRVAATNDFLFNEVSPMIQKWKDHLFEQYGGFVLPDDLSEELFLPPHGYVHQHGLSLLDPRTYDRLRRWCVATGRFSSHMLTAEEVCSELLRKKLIDIHHFQYLEQDLSRRGLWNRSRKHADDLGLLPKPY